MARPAILLSIVLGACGPTGRPTADPGASEVNARRGVPVELDGSASRGQISAYEWDFGDGSGKQPGPKVSHIYSVDGDFSASLTVKGPGGVHSAPVLVHVDAGCVTKAVIGVTTLDPQPAKPVIFNSTGSTGCSGAALTEFHWDFGDGERADGDTQKATVSHTYAAKGTYAVVLRVVDATGTEGRSTRTLNVGVAGSKPTVQCAPTASAVAGKPAAFTASGSDPGGTGISTYAWVFSDDGGTATGASVTHTFAQPGPFTAQVTASTSDARSSDPCTTQVTVSAPPNYGGTWSPLNPASTQMSGCSQFAVPFPATQLAVSHAGSSMTVTPYGNGWPGGYDLTGSEDAPPAMPGTFRVRNVLPNQNKGTCGSVVPEHSVKLAFTSSASVSGTWSIVYTASCVPGCSALCNCVATTDFTAQKP